MGGEDPAAVALAARQARSRQVARVVAGGCACREVVIGAAAVVVRRGRRRGWRPAA
jgi:hypothetical protein